MPQPQQDDYSQDRTAIIVEISGEEQQISEEERQEEYRRLWEEKLQVFGTGVEQEAEEFERIRKPVEYRMIQDMLQFHGSEDTVDKLNKNQTKKPESTGSDLNVNITRKKTNAAEARLSDMLFPTDDKNWDIVPSPIPLEVIEGMPKAAPDQPPPPQQQQSPPPAQPDAMQLSQGSMQAPGGVAATGITGQAEGPQPVGNEGQQDMAGIMQMVQGQGSVAQEPPPPQSTPEEKALHEAKARAELMVKNIEDQLIECNYSIAGREAIRSGCLLGTGILKGPVLLGKGRRAWIKEEDGQGNVAYVIKEVEDNSPGYEFVPAWDFFPTMSATKIEDSEITFQRHWLTRRDLIRLAKRDDFLKDQIRKVLRQSPARIPPDYLTQLRYMSNIGAVGDENRYVVWERHGPIRTEDLQAVGVIEKDAEVDPLDEFQGVVWVCQGIVIKAAINPMDTEDQPFSVFCFEKDDSCIFGYGVPYLMRQAALVVKKAWRMIMDNAGLSVGGQIIINKKVIEPARTPDGRESWDITPLKVWLLKDSNARAQDAFHIFEFPNHQKELAAIFQIAREMADEETGIPLIAEGEQGANVTQTAHGMEMLMNSHNIVMRRAVKNWDDNMTIPNITRAIDWNMQYNPNNDIKGDFSPVAKGSSALLLKETQARNILNLVNFLMTPNFAGWVKVLPTIRKMVSSMQHDPDEFIKTQPEYDSDAQKAQQAAAQNPNPANNAIEIQKMKNDLAYQVHKEKMQNVAADRQFQAMVMDKEHEIEVMKLAQAKDLTIAQISAQLQAIHDKSVADRTLMADETKVKLHFGTGL